MINSAIWKEYLNKQKNLDPSLEEKIISIFEFVEQNFLQLNLEIKWNEPMFSINNSFIIAFSIFKNHISISPEKYAIQIFKEDLLSCNYELTSNLFKIKKDQDVVFDIISKIINFKIKDKANSLTFFKKENKE